MRNGKNDSLKLNEAQAMTPAVSPVEAMRKQLALALFDAVKPRDVIDLAMKLKEQAMAGDLKAAKLYLDLMLGKDQKPTAEVPGMTLMAEALRDLVDEIRVTKARSARAEREALPLANGEENHP